MARVFAEKQCAHCHTRFVPTGARQVYCSQDCKFFAAKRLPTVGDGSLETRRMEPARCGRCGSVLTIHCSPGCVGD